MHRLCIVLLCISFTAPAHALRCGTGVVSEGESTFELLQTCGEPTLTEHTERKVPYQIYDRVHGRYNTAYDNVPVEIWTYNFGPRRFIQRITIENGRIKRIERGGYGH